jgi:hypothetical protein
MRGGKRENSGRKRKDPTSTISFRVKDDDKNWLKENFQNINSLFVNFVDYLKSSKNE